jgi:predicted Zn-ribbon and HTH transcriptional regulator
MLSEPNRRLLRIIDERRPSSLAELEALTGRRASNLSRTLKTMSRYGLVRLVPGKRSAVAPECWCAKCGWTCRSSDDGRPFCRCPRISRLRRFAAAVRENVRPALDA